MKSKLSKNLSPLMVANSIIAIGVESCSPVSHLKLQKLLYYAHGWWLALTDNPLINEPIVAWKHGPVVESIYAKFKHFGSSPIEAPEPDWDGSREITMPMIPMSESALWSFLGRIWETYGKYEPIALSSMTHKEGTPWHKTVSGDGGINEVIDNDLIKEYFQGVATRGK